VPHVHVRVFQTNQVDRGSIDFYIGHFSEDILVTSANATDWISQTADYADVNDFRSSCKVDDVRVPVCLGLSIPFLFLTAYCLHRRKSDHLDANWRRATIASLIIFGCWMFLATVFWWQGCYSFVRAAVDSTGQRAFFDVEFAG